MKKSIRNMFQLALFAFMLVFSFSAVVFGATESNSFTALSIDLINQNPDPVYAGDIVEVSLSVSNAGYGTIDTATLRVDDEYPFTVISNNEIKLTNILSSSSYNSVVKFKLKIDKDANAGNYYLTVKQIEGGSVKEYKVLVSINSNKNVQITNISENSLLPGSTKLVIFTLKNVGTTNLRNLGFSWSEKNDILLSVNSDNKVYIDSLKIGEEKEVSFLISASSAASADLYKLDLVVSYQNDADTNVITQSSYAGLYVGGETDFDVIFNEMSTSEYIYTIANIGSNDAKSVKVSVDSSSKWLASSRVSQIIGNLNKGDYTTISFKFSRTNGPLLFNVEYTDTSGKRVSTIKKVDMNLETSSGNMTEMSNRRSGNFTSTSVSGVNRNPQNQMQSSMSILGTYATYAGYALVLLFIGIVTYVVFRKKSNQVSKK